MTLWIARDKSDSLYLWRDKPQKRGNRFIGYYLGELNWELYPEITFEKSPQEIEIKLIEKNELRKYK